MDDEVAADDRQAGVGPLVGHVDVPAGGLHAALDELVLGAGVEEVPLDGVGLAGAQGRGILESAVEAFGLPQNPVPVMASDLLVWLGPCIGPAAFEVGPDVLLAFGAGWYGAASTSDRPRSRAGISVW